MSWIGNGPELVANLISEFTERGHFACKKILTSNFCLANEHEKNIILSEVGDPYKIDAYASSFLICITKFQKSNKSSSLPARICPAEASSRALEG